ncbi:MAG TPA: sigma-54 dependent transcriptional regulator [Kiloniellaceae bacterium]
MANEILIVDDEADIRMLITGILQDEGYETCDAGDSDGALELLRQRRPSLVVLDIWLENSALDGMEILSTVKQESPATPVVMISGHGNIETAVNAIKLGAYDFIEKPFKSDRLLLVVQRAIEAARLRSENEELRLRIGQTSDFLGSSPWFHHVSQAIRKVAPTGSRVLITGPAGAGKEVVARQLHSCSHRATAPFVALNCATMHPDRLEPELFGVEPGLLEGDGIGKIGTFEKAHGGTLFLDEVADMPMETQGKIVRVLQEQTFQRVGGDKRVAVDVRVIAATSRDLPGLIAEGRFREDLFYRLNVVPIEVPALRERREDIPEMVAQFMERAAENAGLPPRALSDDALAALRAYDWPGNVRQLRNIIEWVLIMAPGRPQDPVRPDMLPPEIGASAPASLPGENGEEIMSLPLREAREVFERQYLEAQVMRFGGNISRTASFVGMERSALHRKLRSLGVGSTERA